MNLTINSTNRFFRSAKDSDDKDDSIDPKVIDADLRDGIEKELRRPDISDADRKQYEEALKKLDAEDEHQNA